MSVDQSQKRMFFYERELAGEFDEVMNMYDLNKRMEVVYSDLLNNDLKNKKLLDAGCGTGWFSKRACELEAEVTSLDLGENLLNEVAKKCDSRRVQGSILELPFNDNEFDIVVSSEVIEHIPRPLDAIDEFFRVLKPDGILVLTTPNKLWFFSIWLANVLGLRPYQGLENWVSWYQMKKKINEAGFIREDIRGIHLFPFIFKFSYGTLDFFNRFSHFLGPVMLNMAVRARKPKS